MYTLVIFLLSCLLSTALAADVPYTFTTLDISVPGHPATLTVPDDINDSGIVISNGAGVTIISESSNPRRNKFKNAPVTFSCGDSLGLSVNDKGQVTGSCAEGAFVRQPDGTILILSALDNALGFNISTDGYVTGQYCVTNGPPFFGCTIHGFTWSPGAGYQTIDHIDGRAGTHTRSVLLARNKHGKILGEYYVDLDTTNETIEHGYFLYDNGVFDTVSLPKSFEWRGGEGKFLTDLNDDDQTIIMTWNNGMPKLQLWDDSLLFDIALPQDWIVQDLGGMNNKGQFVGVYAIQVGIDPVFEFPIYAHHGFVATPAPMATADKKGRK